MFKSVYTLYGRNVEDKEGEIEREKEKCKLTEGSRKKVIFLSVSSTKAQP